MLLYTIFQSFGHFSLILAKTIVSIVRIGIFLGAGISPTITIILLVLGGILVCGIPYLGTLAVIPYIYAIDILAVFGMSKKDVGWSVVYDARTKLPIDPAYVIVRDMQGREISTIITDLNGRFALLLPRGLYRIEAHKSNYTFPSAKLINEHSDGKYAHLYFGSVIEITDKERAVAVSIPMDPIDEDWNQVEKKRKKLFFRFDDQRTYTHAAKRYSSIALVLSILHYGVFLDTASLSILQAASIVAVCVYIYAWSSRQYAHSFIIDKQTNTPLPFARVTVFSHHTHAKVAQKITSFEGQFTCLLSKGEYYLQIEKRNEHGGYDLIATTDAFSIHDGYIGKRFVV